MVQSKSAPPSTGFSHINSTKMDNFDIFIWYKGLLTETLPVPVALGCICVIFFTTFPDDSNVVIPPDVFNRVPEATVATLFTPDVVVLVDDSGFSRLVLVAVMTLG